MAITKNAARQLVNAIRIVLANKDDGGQEWARNAIVNILDGSTTSDTIAQGSAPTTDGTYKYWEDNSGNPGKLYVLLNDSGGTPTWVGPIAQGPSSIP
ncbi:MAG: hypothetical protein JSV86_21595 [Gemmatimonadota bacterium]|nr:MAG: hypothetical protein JSV86_21595 [Gemmatimonadota bacterium]